MILNLIASLIVAGIFLGIVIHLVNDPYDRQIAWYAVKVMVGAAIVIWAFRRVFQMLGGM